jgi:hypothetical protein
VFVAALYPSGTCPAITVSPTSLGTGVVGTAYRATLSGEELDRFEILGAQGAAAHASYSGYLRTAEGLAALPIGSHLDAATGALTWQPGPGFLGAYDVVLVRWTDGHPASRRELRIVIRPKQHARVGPQVVIDAPGPEQIVEQPFVVTGWAIDADAAEGAGVGTVHVWAYPADGGDPQFLGVAAYGGARPDVGALFGPEFTASGYGLVVSGLAPGAYDLAVFAWSTELGRFAPARTVRVVVK